MRSIHIALAILVGLFGAGAVNGYAAAAMPGPCFKIFDATGYDHKPDLTTLQIEPAALFEPDRWWPNPSRDDLPAPTAAAQWARQISPLHGQLVLDIERWPLRGRHEDIVESIRRYIVVLDRLRGAGVERPMGYYGVMPVWDHDRAIGVEQSDTYRQWQQENDLLRPLVAKVDALFPSLYTQDEDIEDWVRFARANLREARRISQGKPVYPFLWPQFHDSNHAIGLKYLPAAMWRRELEVVSAEADGVVIWGGARDSQTHRIPRWDGAAEWWLATRQFRTTRPGCARAPSR